VVDTGVVASALLFARGRLAWLCQYWRSSASTFLVSKATVDELIRVFAYPKFRLSAEDQLELLSNYLPYCEIVTGTPTCAIACRDPKDQALLDLAESGQADLLVTGDNDPLVLRAETRFHIESPEEFRMRLRGRE
jgi:putative PIN family toxin of toxin-antitoxin system